MSFALLLNALEPAAWLALITVLAGRLFARQSWHAELVTHFFPHFALFLLAAAGLLFAGGRYAGAAFMLAGAVAAAAPLLRRLKQRPPAVRPIPGGETLKLISANLLHSNHGFVALQKLLADENPDILLLLELTPRQLDGLQNMLAPFPHRIVAARDGGFGIGLFSRLPLDEPGVDCLAGIERVPIVQTGIRWGERKATLLGVHLLAPEDRVSAPGRNRQILALAERVLQNPYPEQEFILVGDFNITPWSPFFSPLLTGTGLRRAEQSPMQAASFPVGLGPFGIAIDHCLLTPGIAARRASRGPNIGSDHYPLMLELVWADNNRPTSASNASS